jgi:hypothetical protein
MRVLLLNAVSGLRTATFFNAPQLLKLPKSITPA